MKPDDLDDLDPVEPDRELLDRVHARSDSFRRRRRTQRFASVAVGLVVLATAGGIALTRVDTNSNNVSGPQPSPTSTTIPPKITADAIIGEWRPVSISGYHGPLTSPPLGNQSLLRFQANGKWDGSDGCNGQVGSYALGADGALRFALHASTEVACRLQTPAPQSLEAATRVDVHGTRLTFFGTDDHVLARYERTGITARLVLPSTTMTVGSTMTGSVVVDNYTGHAVHVVGCGGIFAVTLSNTNGSQGAPIWPSCRMNITIPIGTTTYPVAIQATYRECSDTPSATLHLCAGAGRLPPLNPAVYQATLAQSTTVVATPPSVAVTLVAKSVADLRDAALAWSKAFLTGTPADIFAMEGPECRPTTGTTASGSTVSAYLAGERAVMKQHFGMPLDAITEHGVAIRNVTGTTGEARVLYDLPESKTGNDNWVTYSLHDGAWKVSDCNAPIGGSSSSSSSASP